MENFIFCAVKAIGICAGDFWIRADLLHQVRWSEGYPIWKSARSNLYLEVKACILTPQINQTFKRNLCITYCRLFLSKLGRYSIKLLLQMFDKTQKWWWLCWKTGVSEKHIFRLNKNLIIIPVLRYVKKVPLHKKWSFPLRIYPVNVTKSAGNCGFGHIYWRNP